jgi:hypothetical protein
MPEPGFCTVRHETTPAVRSRHRTAFDLCESGTAVARVRVGRRRGRVSTHAALLLDSSTGALLA